MILVEMKKKNFKNIRPDKQRFSRKHQLQARLKDRLKEAEKGDCIGNTQHKWKTRRNYPFGRKSKATINKFCKKCDVNFNEWKKKQDVGFRTR